MKVKTLAFLVIILMLLAMTFYPTGSRQVSAQSEAALTTVYTATRAEQRAALKYWTREAIAAAEPVPMPVDMGTPSVESFGIMPQEATGAFGSSPAGAADPAAAAVLKKFYWNDWKATAEPALAIEADEPAGTTQTFDSYIINNWNLMGKMYPHEWVGRFTSSAGYCSATAISNNHIVTAAHCVYDTVANTWYTSFAFTPAYSDGKTPYGVFPYTSCRIMTAYINYSGAYSISGWAPMDVAVCGMGVNGAGLTLNQAVGWAGRQWNYGYVRHYFDMGYPFRNTDGVLLTGAGKFLRTCVSESFQAYTDVLGTGCDLGPGISGGPWLTGYKMMVATGYVNGVNSGYFTGTDNMYAGRFSDANIVQLCNADGC